MSLIFIFVAKYWFCLLIFFISIWFLFWAIWCNYVSSVVTWCHISVPEFFFFTFFIFIYLLKKIATCHADVVSCGSDNATCHYYAKCHFLILDLVLYFLFLSQFSLIFYKNWAILSFSKLKQNLIFL